jgi:uncharacterized protein YqjF (DUF2071 family)
VSNFNYAILEQTAHRPWKMPDAPWVMTQTWNDLLFAHWPVDAGQLRSNVPAEFPLDLFDGRAWLSIVPFHMTNVTPRAVPTLPRISAFPELNVRTYVTRDDRPGVYFFSLDAGSSVAVYAARALLNMPYYSARMRVITNGGDVGYHSKRSKSALGELSGTYEPTGSPFAPAPGTLEYFLTERYCLYNVNRRGQPYRLEIHHPPWPLQPASARFARNTMAEVNGLSLPDEQPLLQFSKRQDVVTWAPVRLR